MAIRTIMLLGNPVLRTRCKAVPRSAREERARLARDLRDTLANFRTQRGFGRGIAAPQIGSTVRAIHIEPEIGGAMFNPRIVRRSRRTFLLWDDCFSFPDLLVRLRRHHTIEVAYEDAEGHRRTVKATGSLSELLQHEIDHLDGILAIDRAIDQKHIILRSELDRFTAGKGISL
ncbi:MAG: peptide deformylase [Bacteroidetes bacterium]|nr:peptide deformylase [Bacteroidota bacterium]